MSTPEMPGNQRPAEEHKREASSFRPLREQRQGVYERGTPPLLYLKSHDKKFIPLLMVAAVLLYITPDDMVETMVQSQVFDWLVSINHFALRMANYGDKPKYALFCYGMSTLLVPYFFYALFNSPEVKAGVAKRSARGRDAVIASAIFCAIVFAYLFFFFRQYSLESFSGIRLQHFIFDSKIGIALMSLGVTFLLVAMLVYFLLFTNEFFKKGNEA